MSSSHLPLAHDFSSLEDQQAILRKKVQNDINLRPEVPINPDGILARDGFTYEKYRVGSPPLQILPLGFHPIKQRTPVYILLENLRFQLEAILVKYGIELDDEREDGKVGDIQFVHRTVDDDEPSNDNLTVWIPAIWDEKPLDWLRAVKAMRLLLLKDPITKSIKVEMISHELYRSKMIAAVQVDHPIVAAWNTISPLIHEVFETFEQLRNGWRSVSVRAMGHQDWWGGSGPLPTVIRILVNWDVNPVHWESPKIRIQDLLKSHNLADVEVVFSRGGIRYNTLPARNSIKGSGVGDDIHESYSEAIQMGMEFGPERSFTQAPGEQITGPSSTLGGYIKVTDLSNMKKTLVGLVNYNIVREAVEGFRYREGADGTPIKADAPPGSDLDLIDRNGMGPTFAKREDMVFEAPSRRKHNFSLEHLQDELEWSKRGWGLHDAHTLYLQAGLNQKTKFFDEGKNDFGVTWAASGFCRRTDENGRLDWALIAFTNPNRRSTNIIPAGTWRNTRNEELIIKDIATCNDPTETNYVQKIGGRCGPTRGHINPLKDDVRMSLVDGPLGLAYSSEFVFISDSTEQHASTLSDSGSFLFTTRGKFIGLPWGHPTGNSCMRSAEMYVTDAAALMKDLNEKFRGEYVFELPGKEVKGKKQNKKEKRERKKNSRLTS